MSYLCISCISAYKRTGAKVQKNWCRVYKSVTFLKNWEEISPELLHSFDNEELGPDDVNLSSDMFVSTW